MFPVRVYVGECVYLWAAFTKCFPSSNGDGKQKRKTIKVMASTITTDIIFDHRG